MYTLVIFAVAIDPNSGAGMAVGNGVAITKIHGLNEPEAEAAAIAAKAAKFNQMMVTCAYFPSAKP